MVRARSSSSAADDVVQHQARALGDPTRHALFRWVTDREAPSSVADLEAAFGLNHSTIRQHLALLVDAELLTETVAAPTGPGRPRLLYEVAPGVAGTWTKDGPYQRLAMMLLEMLHSGHSAREVGAETARRLTTAEPATGDPWDAIEHRAASQGFMPQRVERRDGVDLVLRKCPFEDAAATDPSVVCELHRGLAEGVADAVGGVEVIDLVVRPARRAGCRLELAEPAAG